MLVQDSVLEEGLSDHVETSSARAFVADGVGGNPAPHRASDFVIRRVAERLEPGTRRSPEELRALLDALNRELVDEHRDTPCSGAATTLAGVLVAEDDCVTVNAGDSEIWVFREGRLFQITEPQTLGGLPGSPITSYFGGDGHALSVSFDCTLDAVRAGDVFVICSDGLFKAVSTAEARAALSARSSLPARARDLLDRALASGLRDDTSCVLVEVIDE